MRGPGAPGVFIVASHVSEVGGAAKATRLLCEAALEAGYASTLFVVLPPPPELARRLGARGLRIVSAPVLKGFRWDVPTRLLALRVFAAARRERPRLIHVVGLGVEGRRLLRLPRTAPVYLWETTEALARSKFLDGRIAPLLPRAAAVLAPSRTVAANVRATYRYRGPVDILPFWTEPPPRPPAPAARSRIVTYLGRIEAEKGLPQLLDAAERSTYLASGAATLRVCGDGDRSVLRPAGAHVQLTGRLDDAGFQRALEETELLVLPSLSEGYPLILLEACARGKPVIATEVGSIPEVFGGRACALLVPPGDAQALAAAIDRLLAEDDLVYRARCADALALFAERASPSVILRRLIEVYEAAASAAAPRAMRA